MLLVATTAPTPIALCRTKSQAPIPLKGPPLGVMAWRPWYLAGGRAQRAGPLSRLAGRWCTSQTFESWASGQQPSPRRRRRRRTVLGQDPRQGEGAQHSHRAAAVNCQRGTTFKAAADFGLRQVASALVAAAVVADIDVAVRPSVFWCASLRWSTASTVGLAPAGLKVCLPRSPARAPSELQTAG